MGGITMWIILGSLVGVVAIFLVVASILDRKKVKKVRAEKAEVTKLQQSARTNVAIWVNLVAKANSNLMKDFVPSVGSVKMSDIREKARKSLELLERKKEFKLASEAKENADLMKHYQELKDTNSNIWDTKLEATLKFFINEEKLGLEGKQPAPKKEKTSARDQEAKAKKAKKVKVNSGVNIQEVIDASKAFKEEAAKMIKGEYK